MSWLLPSWRHSGWRPRMSRMSIDALLANITPKAIAWAKAQSEGALASGLPLNAEEIELAKNVGVREAARVRIAWVNRLPIPVDPAFQPLLDSTGLADMAGLTLGYAIFLVPSRANHGLLAHELRHVHQYEQLGGIDGFMPVYLDQVARLEYDNAPLEIDAYEYELMARSGKLSG